MAGGNRKNADAALIAALAGGSTVKDAAATAGIGESTVYRRLQDEAFHKRVDEARAELIARVVGQLADGASEAAETPPRALLGVETPPAVRLGAARSILELVVKLREHDEIHARLVALEPQVAEDRPQQGGGRWAS